MKIRDICGVLLVEVSLVFCSCNRQYTEENLPIGQPIMNTTLRISADTIHDGGLCLLHRVSIADREGNVLFVDSVNDYEPDSIYAIKKEDGILCITFRLFDPCDDTQRLLIYTDGDTIISHQLINQ